MAGLTGQFLLYEVNFTYYKNINYIMIGLKYKG